MAVGGRALVDGTRDVAPMSGVDFLLQIEINSMLKIEQPVCVSGSFHSVKYGTRTESIESNFMVHLSPRE